MPSARRGRKPKAPALDAPAEAAKASAQPPPPAEEPQAKSSILSGPVRAGNELYFTPADRLLYENKQLVVKNALQAIALKKLEMAQTRSAFQEQVRKLDGDLTQLTQDAKAQEESLRALQTELASVYRVDLQKIAYDTESGRISFLP